MTASDALHEAPFLLGEGSMYERLRRSDDVAFDPDVAHGGLIYDDASRDVLTQVHREYLDIGQRYGIPMIATTPTWRANTERVSRSPFAGLPVNRDGVAYMTALRAGYGGDASPILIGGQIGPKGDAYSPQEAPGADDAEAFHRPQIEELADAGVDLLIAQTLPAADEALGIARVMARTGVPYVLSYVVRQNGTLLDGTALDEAVRRIDDAVERPALHHAVNCVHGSVFAAAMTATQARDAHAARRISGLSANTSAKTPEELDGLVELDTEAPEDFGTNLLGVRQAFGSRFLGGCCGTSTAHIEALAQRWAG